MSRYRRATVDRPSTPGRTSWPLLIRERASAFRGARAKLSAGIFGRTAPSHDHALSLPHRAPESRDTPGTPVRQARSAIASYPIRDGTRVGSRYREDERREPSAYFRRAGTTLTSPQGREWAVEVRKSGQSRLAGNSNVLAKNIKNGLREWHDITRPRRNVCVEG
jgi:hypothetical protein